MERIGLAASKISKGNFFLYNIVVVGITIMFSLFIFFIAGSSIALALIILGYIMQGIMPTGFSQEWWGIFKLCMVTLTIVVGLFSLFAILKNWKVSKPK